MGYPQVIQLLTQFGLLGFLGVFAIGLGCLMLRADLADPGRRRSAPSGAVSEFPPALVLRPDDTGLSSPDQPDRSVA